MEINLILNITLTCEFSRKWCQTFSCYGNVLSYFCFQSQTEREMKKPCIMRSCQEWHSKTFPQRRVIIIYNKLVAARSTYTNPVLCLVKPDVWCGIVWCLFIDRSKSGRYVNVIFSRPQDENHIEKCFSNDVRYEVSELCIFPSSIIVPSFQHDNQIL